MARIRTVKPTFFTSLDINQLPDDSTRLHFIGLWTYADDAGRGVDDPRLIKAALWPLDDRKTLARIEKMQKALADSGHILRYEHEERRYFAVVNWNHQKIDRPSPVTIPAPSSQRQRGDASSNDQRTLDEGSPQEGKGEERKGNSSSSVGLQPPAAPPAETTTTEASQPDLTALWQMLARRDLRKRVDDGKGTPGDEPAWLAEAARRRQERHAADVARWLAAQPGLAVAALADRIASGGHVAHPSTRSASQPAAFVPLGDDDGPTEAGHSGAAAAREALARARR